MPDLEQREIWGDPDAPRCSQPRAGWALLACALVIAVGVFQPWLRLHYSTTASTYGPGPSLPTLHAERSLHGNSNLGGFVSLLCAGVLSGLGLALLNGARLRFARWVARGLAATTLVSCWLEGHYLARDLPRLGTQFIHVSTSLGRGVYVTVAGASIALAAAFLVRTDS